MPKRADNAISVFPDPELANEDGLLAIGGDLEVETLHEAYSLGIFPWPQADLPMLWFSPRERGVMDFDRLHISKSLSKTISKSQWRWTWNQEFEKVIKACAKAPRPGQLGTWITPEMLKAYIRFHEAGHAHSLECWADERLVGGIYGTYVRGVFSGESMFHLVPNASKVALVTLIQFLEYAGLKWMDTQMVTSVIEKMGAHVIARKDFLRRVRVAHKSKIELGAKQFADFLHDRKKSRGDD